MFLLCPLNVLLTELHLLPKQNISGKLFPTASTLQQLHLYPDTSAKSIRENSSLGTGQDTPRHQTVSAKNVFTPEGQAVGGKGREGAAKATEAEASAASKQVQAFLWVFKGERREGSVLG